MSTRPLGEPEEEEEERNDSDPLAHDSVRPRRGIVSSPFRELSENEIIGNIVTTVAEQLGMNAEQTEKYKYETAKVNAKLASDQTETDRLRIEKEADSRNRRHWVVGTTVLGVTAVLITALITGRDSFAKDALTFLAILLGAGGAYAAGKSKP